jgi:anti-sigma factor RsiW
MSTYPATEETTCQESEALLPLVADGVLTPAEDPHLFAHLASCEKCQKSLAMHDVVELALRQKPRKKARILPFLRAAWPYAAAAGLLLVAGGVSALLQQQLNQPAPAPVVETKPTAPAVVATPVAKGTSRIVGLVPGSNQGQPIYIIESEGRRFPVDRDCIDGGERGAGSNASVPVLMLAPK